MVSGFRLQPLSLHENSCVQPLPLYTNSTLRGDLWDFTWLNHIIVLYSPVTKSELHTRFIALFKMVAYSALCNKAIAEYYYKMMDSKIARVIEEQGEESPQAAFSYYYNRAKNSSQTETKELESFEENRVPNYADLSDLLNVAPVVTPAAPLVVQEASLPIARTLTIVSLPEKLWAEYRIHPHQQGVAAMPSFQLFVQGVLARERGLTDLVASIVCAGWSQGVRADDLPILECGVSEQTWFVFRTYCGLLSNPGAFPKLPLLMQTLILESALVKTALGLFNLKAKTQVGSWLDWYDLLKKGPIVVKATLGDRYLLKAKVAPTAEAWNGETIFAYPIGAVRVNHYTTQTSLQEACVVVAANALILVGGKTVKTEQEGYGNSCIYFRQTQRGPLFKITWIEFRKNLVSFDGLLFSPIPSSRKPDVQSDNGASASPPVWAIYSTNKA